MQTKIHNFYWELPVFGITVLLMYAQPAKCITTTVNLHNKKEVERKKQTLRDKYDKIIIILFEITFSLTKPSF